MSPRLYWQRRYARKAGKVDRCLLSEKAYSCKVSHLAVISRQFRDMSRTRIESLLASLPKLIPTNTQHTSVETAEVLYAYQLLEDLYSLDHRQEKIQETIARVCAVPFNSRHILIIVSLEQRSRGQRGTQMSWYAARNAETRAATSSSPLPSAPVTIPAICLQSPTMGHVECY